MHSIQDVNPSTASPPAVLLTVSHLHIRQQQQVLLHDLNLELHAGETIAVVGESGSGKSISSLALLGLLPEHLQVQGQAIFAEQDLLRLKPQQLRQVRGKNYW